jgi:hypothetical protein
MRNRQARQQFTPPQVEEAEYSPRVEQALQSGPRYRRAADVLRERYARHRTILDQHIRAREQQREWQLDANKQTRQEALVEF